MFCSVLSPPRFEGRPHHARCCSNVTRLLSSVILIKSSCVRPVHVLIFSIQLILGLPFPRPPGTVPCMISFSKHDPSFLMMWTCPKYFIFLSFTIPSNFLSTPAFSNIHLFVRFSVHD